MNKELPAAPAVAPEICGRCGQPRSATCGDDFIPMSHPAVAPASAVADAARRVMSVVGNASPGFLFAAGGRSTPIPTDQCMRADDLRAICDAALSAPPAAQPAQAVTDALDLERLRAIVDAAAPDPWTVRNDNEGEDPPRPLWIVENADMETPDDADNSPIPFQAAIHYGSRADADFIATFSPSLIRRLIDAAERARSAQPASESTPDAAALLDFDAWFASYYDAPTGVVFMRGVCRAAWDAATDRLRTMETKPASGVAITPRMAETLQAAINKYQMPGFGPAPFRVTLQTAAEMLHDALAAEADASKV